MKFLIEHFVLTLTGIVLFLFCLSRLLRLRAPRCTQCGTRERYTYTKHTGQRSVAHYQCPGCHIEQTVIASDWNNFEDRLTEGHN